MVYTLVQLNNEVFNKLTVDECRINKVNFSVSLQMLIDS